MCGFAGIVAWDERFRIDPTVLGRASACIAHRGPDGEGLHISPEGPITRDDPQVGLAHRRLAIIDPEHRADQPFTDGQGRWIVFNGEVYNYRALRGELERIAPRQWKTTCDTEVLLAGCAQWGEGCVKRLNGMYAFATWDGNSRELLLGRDRMGQKPLYIAAIDASGSPVHLDETGVLPPLGAIAFASELYALRQVPWIDSRLDELALVEYLRWGYIPAPRSIYRGIQKLPPASVMRISAGGGQSSIYFQPTADGEVGSPPDGYARTQARSLVIEAVRRQLISDVPLGCFLSGGIDSSVIAAAMKSAAPNQRIVSFCVGFDDPRYDERPYAAAVAERLGTEHHDFLVHPNAAEDLPKLVRVFGEPFGDSSALPTHYLARATRGFVKVALSGDGGDELFGGYDRYRALSISQRLHRWPGVLRELARQCPRLLPGSHPKRRLARLKRLLDSIDQPPAQRYSTYMRLFTDEQIKTLTGETPRRPDLIERLFAQFAGDGMVRAASAADRLSYLPEDLLTKVDRASMLHALEVRSPFMDHHLVHFAATLSRDQLLGGGGKRMLREAFTADLPPQVFRRRKMGFAVPIGDWFRGELREMLHDHLLGGDSFAAGRFQRNVILKLLDEHQSQRFDHTQRLYALLMLEIWHRQQAG